MIRRRVGVRTRRGAAVVGAALLVCLVAQPSPALTTFEPGSVQTHAQALRIGGFIGGTEATIRLGLSIVRAQGAQGNSQAQAIDLGLYGILISQPNACTGDPPVAPDQLPQPLRVNSVKGDRSASHTYADGQIIKGGDEHAAATTQPSASASVDFDDVDLPGALTAAGLHTDALARISAPDRRRDSDATATTRSIDIAGGLVRLGGLKWTVSRTTGEGAKQSAAFDITSISVAGTLLPMSPGQIIDSLEAANAVLKNLGIVIDVPKVIHRADGTVAVTPLDVRFGGSDQVNPVLGPALRQLQPLRDQLYALAHSTKCPVDPTILNAGFTVLDLGLAAMTGSGGLLFEFGGIDTLHDTTTYANPLGQLPAFVPPAPLQPGAPTVVGGTADQRTPDTRHLTGAQAAAGHTTVRCITTHPSGAPSCARTHAVLAGLIALLVIAALVGAETYKARKRATA